MEQQNAFNQIALALPIEHPANANPRMQRPFLRTPLPRRVNIVKRIFKWAASEELIPVTVYEALRTLAGLRSGRATRHRHRRPPREARNKYTSWTHQKMMVPRSYVGVVVAGGESRNEYEPRRACPFGS